MPNYQTGDILRDKAGYPVIVHHEDGAFSWSPTPLELLMRTAKGDVTLEEYAGIVSNHVNVELAYRFGSELPDGASVTNELDIV